MDEFSNNDRDIFIVRTRKMIDRGALMSRYSRTTELDIRNVYRKEFADSETRGEEFYRRVFLEYGDESVAELVTAQVAIQNVSNLCTWTMEEKRIGLSFLEKSSRYVEYQEGSRLYLEPSRSGLPEWSWKEYGAICDELFRLYRKVLSNAVSYYMEAYPMEGFSFPDADGNQKLFGSLKDEKKISSARKAYDRAVRARALDDARFCLPFSTLTNAGVSGNGRAFIDLIMKLNASGLPELRKVAEGLFTELKLELPNLIDNAVNRHGRETEAYSLARDSLDMSFSELSEVSGVKILKCDSESEALARMRIALQFLSSGTESTPDATGGGNEDVISYINRSSEIRQNRRQKPGRVFEIPEYLCAATCSLGTLRDFQRHRMMTVIKRPVNPLSGYILPESVHASQELMNDYRSTMERSKAFWRKLLPEAGAVKAQYAIPFAFYQKIVFKLNLRELTYFTELRSGSAAHFEIRKIAIQLLEELRKYQPNLSKIVRFVDAADYPLGRLGAEVRKEDRLSSLRKTPD